MSPPGLVASPHGALPGPSPLGMSPLGMPGATPHSAAPAPAPAWGTPPARTTSRVSGNAPPRRGWRTRQPCLLPRRSAPRRAMDRTRRIAASRGLRTNRKRARLWLWPSATAAARAGVSDLFKHGGEASGTVPLRNVLFANSLKRSNGFLSAVEKLDASSPEALIAAAERVAAAIRETQAVSNVDVFDDLMGRLEALNASASHSAAVIRSSTAVRASSGTAKRSRGVTAKPPGRRPSWRRPRTR